MEEDLEPAPFGGLLPPPHLALTRRKPPVKLDMPSKSYPEVSGPPRAIMARAAAAQPVNLVRRTRTLQGANAEAQRAERLSGEIIGKVPQVPTF